MLRAHRELPFEDVWAMFGEGRHPHIERLYETRLAPFMTQVSLCCLIQISKATVTDRL
jgi:Protein of unknown function (DUF3419)